MKVSLVSVTQPSLSSSPVEGKQAEDLWDVHMTAEDLIVYTARVSNPSNQANTSTAPKLIAYLIKHKHWSPFEMVDMTVEIETSRAIAAQILRHRSFSFQEFSQRYAEATLGFEEVVPRRQDTKNRQNSIDDLPPETKTWFRAVMTQVHEFSEDMYAEALRHGVAKESARFLLPLSTTTRLYMKGSVRSWIHYLEARLDPSTQKEHRDIAEMVNFIFAEQFPNVARALEIP